MLNKSYCCCFSICYCIATVSIAFINPIAIFYSFYKSYFYCFKASTVLLTDLFWFTQLCG